LTWTPVSAPVGVSRRRVGRATGPKLRLPQRLAGVADRVFLDAPAYGVEVGAVVDGDREHEVQADLVSDEPGRCPLDPAVARYLGGHRVGHRRRRHGGCPGAGVGFQVELTHPVGADRQQQRLVGSGGAEDAEPQRETEAGANEQQQGEQGRSARLARSAFGFIGLLPAPGRERAGCARRRRGSHAGPATPGTRHRELVPSPVVTTPATAPAGTAGLVDSAKRRSDRPTSADLEPTCGSRPLIRTCTQHWRACECASVRVCECPDHSGFAVTKIAVPGISRPRRGLQPPQTWSCPSGHSGSTTSNSRSSAPTTSRTRSPSVRCCSM